MQNVEFKFELRDAELARLICARNDARHVGTFEQRDTYYRVGDGRLKKRETAGESAEYIFYHRPNRARAKLSHFTIYSEQEAKARFGERPLPVWLIVNKRREVWMWNGVRIHLDFVEQLGCFFEAEALVMPARHVGECHRLLAEIKEAFAPALGEAVAVGYSDMLAAEMESGLLRPSPENEIG